MENTRASNIDFFSTDINKVTATLKKGDQKLMNDGFINALSLFRQASKEVPAYKDFLQKNSINPLKIKTREDFKIIPIINKKNYLKQYSLNELSFNGSLSKLNMLSSSSGSTGEPFLWPRGDEQDLEGSITHEVIFKEFFHIDEYKNLFINCFSMGTWVAGPFVMSCIQNLNRKGYDILTISPGIDKDITLSLFQKLAPDFNQIIIAGYPPLVKDLLDLGEIHGIKWKKYNIKFLFAAEGFSETWRDYIHKRIGAKDPFHTSINCYGSADATLLAHETPYTTLIRKSLTKSYRSIEKVFGDNRLPTLAQYDPRLKYIEEYNHKLIFTTRSGLPLIRYDIGDEGGLFTFDQLNEKLLSTKISLKDHEFAWKAPFVYVFGRRDLTISFYGLLIYPEHIKLALEKANLQKFISGKFVLSTINNENQDPQIHIRIELSKDIIPPIDLSEILQKKIIQTLKIVNSEYNKLNQALNGKASPQIELIENGNVNYFKSGIKQKWVQN